MSFNSRKLSIFSTLVASSIIFTSIPAAAGGGGNLSSPKPNESYVTRHTRVDSPGRSLHAQLSHVRGAEVAQGQKKKIQGFILNGTSTTQKNVGVTLEFPVGVSGRITTKGWRCAQTSTVKANCRYSKALSPGSQATFFITLATKANAPAGKKKIGIVPFSGQKVRLTGDGVHLNVLDRGVAKFKPIVSYVSKTLTSSGNISRHHVAYTGKRFTYNIKLQNIGHESLLPNEKVTVTQKFGKDIKVLSVSMGEGKDCRIGKSSWTCSVLSKTVIARMDYAGTIRVDVVPVKPGARMDVQVIVVRTQGSRTYETFTPVVTVASGEDDVKVHTKAMHRVNRGGIAKLRVSLENRHRDVVFSGHEVTIKIPRGVTFASYRGSNWSCKKFSESSSNDLVCAYGRQIKKGKISRPIEIATQVSSKSTKKSFEVRISSQHGTATHTIEVDEAPQVDARAKLYRNHKNKLVVALEAKAKVFHETSYAHQWIQRCTTAEDAKSEVCPGGKIAPRVKIEDAKLEHAIAILPETSQAKKFVFEYQAKTDSVTVRKVVSVSAGSVSGNNVSATSAFGPPTMPNSSSVSSATMPSDVVSALSTYGVQLSGTPTSSGSSSIQQFGTLYGNIATQLKPFGTTVKVVVSGTSDNSVCAQALLDTGNVSFLGNKVSVTNFVIAAPRSASCSYRGVPITKGTMFFTMNLFGNSINFRQELNPNAFQGFMDITTTVATLNYPLADSHIDFKNVIVTLRVDLAVKTLGVLLGVDLDVFGTTITLGGLLQLDYKTGVITADLVMAQGKDIVFDGITLSNFMVGAGISYSFNWAPTSLNVMGSGKVSFLGQVIDLRELSFDFADGDITAATVDFAFTNNVPGVYNLNGDFTFQWRQAIEPTPANPSPLPPLEISAGVQFSAGGFQLGTTADPAKLVWSQNCMSIQGEVVVPGVFTADVSGVLMTQTGLGACDNLGIGFGVTGIFGMAPRPGVQGDFRFDASHVKFKFPGIHTTGNLSFGQAFGLPFGMIDVTSTISTTDVKSKVYVNGNFNPLVGVDLTGTSTLDIAGYSIDADIRVHITKEVQEISLSGGLSIAGSSIDVAGSVGVDYIKECSRKTECPPDADSVPYPRISLSGSGQFAIDGYSLGSATFSLKESYHFSGLTASLDLNFGVFSADAYISFGDVNGKMFYTIAANGTVSLGSVRATANIVSNNCSDDTCTKVGKATFQARATFKYDGYSYTTDEFTVPISGKFSVSVGVSGTVDVTPPDSKAEFTYSYTVTMASSSPYLSASQKAHVKAYYRFDKKWYLLADTSSGITFTFNPFYLYVKECVIKSECFSFKVSS